MQYRPPLADHPRAALLVNLLVPFFLFGWIEPRVTGEPRRWPWVIAMSLFFALLLYMVRTRSARFVAYMAIGVSIAMLAVYGVVTFRTGIPHDSTQHLAWLSVFVLPVVGVGFGVWILQHPPKRN